MKQTTSIPETKVMQALKAVKPFIDDLQAENHNERSAGIFKDEGLENAHTLMNKAIAEDAQATTTQELLKDILTCLNGMVRTNVKHPRFKDTYEICSAIGKVIKYPDIYIMPEAATDKWDNVEVQPVHHEEDNCEVCDEGQESFWSVYLHQVEGGVQCVADLPTKELAVSLGKLLDNATKSYVNNGYSINF